MPVLPELSVELERERRRYLHCQADGDIPRTRGQGPLQQLESRFAHSVPAVHTLFDEGIRLPFVWNSSGYESVSTLERYAELCDTALFDLRYANDSTAIAASAAPGYVAAARSAVRWAFERAHVRQDTPPLIVRILVLPGHADEAIENLAWLATELSSEIPVSIMSQFTPAYKALETPPFNRKVTEEEYESVTEAAADFGFENGWIQGYEAADPALALLGENMPEGHGSIGMQAL